MTMEELKRKTNEFLDKCREQGIQPTKLQVKAISLIERAESIDDVTEVLVGYMKRVFRENNIV